MPINDIVDEPLAAEVRAAFVAMTDTVVPAPGDADRLVRAGRRRLYRRRTVTAVAAVAASTVVGGGATLLTTGLRGTGTVPGTTAPAFGQGPYADLYQRPTRGDLADDPTYLAQAVAAWNASHGKVVPGLSLTSGLFDDLRGAPHVIWAGTTPAGPAAIVAQPAWWAQRGPHKTSDELMVTLVGLIGVDDHGNPKVIADDYQPINAWFVDRSLTTLVVADLGFPVTYTAGWTYRTDGTRYLKQIPVQFHDGAAVIKLPHDVDVCAVQLTLPPGAPSPTNIAGAQDWDTYCDRTGRPHTTPSPVR